MTTKEKIAVMQAWINGGSLEWRKKGGFGWLILPRDSIQNEPSWNWELFEYRISYEQSEPMELEFWVHPRGQIIKAMPGDADLSYAGWRKKKFKEIQDDK